MEEDVSRYQSSMMTCMLEKLFFPNMTFLN